MAFVKPSCCQQDLLFGLGFRFCWWLCRYPQRIVLRLCRFGLLGHASSLAEEMKAHARAATEGLAEAMAVATRQQVRRELALLVRAVFNARSYLRAG